MLFTDASFIIGLVLLCIIYFIIPKKYRWMLLLCASVLFYACSGIGYLLYIAATAMSTYFAAVQLDKMAAARQETLTAHKSEWSRDEKKAFKEAANKKRFRLLVLLLVFNFGILAVIKYGGFTVRNLNALIGLFGKKDLLPVPSFLLPMGISFYTFQTMGYAIDVYREKYKAERNPAKLGLFVSFFPQLIQGPISRFDELSKGLFAGNGFDAKRVMFGTQRILWGYFKKMVIADRILPAVTTLIGDPAQYRGVYVFLGILYYTLELYADFTGGIDITIGIGQVLGIPIAENFNRPFFSKNITEYWRRWHITLGTWFKDYLFYPISVCQPMLKLSKWSREKLGKNVGKYLPVYVSTIAVWFVTGLWHGAAWNYILWGLYYFVLLVVDLLWLDKFRKKMNPKIEPLFSHFYFFVATFFGMALFYFDPATLSGTLGTDTGTLANIGAIFGIGCTGFADIFTASTVAAYSFLFLFAAVFSLPVVPTLWKKATGMLNISPAVCRAVKTVTALILIALATVRMAGQTYSPFLYFRF